ncbi:4'-phosphopantetheinyl transferase EntD [Hydrogenophaga palleronii]|uniref:Enterobactin synthase component D n=1 Tax=Hydrogenophaga palleronii TaxID=65655 RepID=A0ABU1WLA0_9BURK|nr:4'-phosphopantetheinyl transferase superfamily protein [Hydrogenophaga palleronii]MDR7150066.1 4'-phosphopantetheinyl transferase EntD [Hydrogenophaga palleronii]
MHAIPLTEEPSQSLQSLRQRLSERLGPGIGIACMDVDGDARRLYSEECAAVRVAVPRRQREFAAGRQAARRAMMDIGWPPLAIPTAPDRSPVWPEGLVGSISHNDQACVAVVCPRGQWQAIGIDIEVHRPIETSLWSTICTPREMALLPSQPRPLRGLAVAHLFSAKEAVYKWQYPLTGRMLDFQQVQITLGATMQTFSARIADTDPAAAPAAEVNGHILVDRDHIVSWVLTRAAC